MANSGKLRYLVLTYPKKTQPANRFFQYCSPAASGMGEPWTAKVDDLDLQQVTELDRDPGADAILSMPYGLIHPINDPAQLPMEGPPDADDSVTWGVSAVNALMCQERGHGVKVAVLDTGIAKGHAAFPPVAERNGIDFKLRDFTDNPEGIAGQADDLHGHGTHCAGTIFGRNVNGTRIGVAPGIERAIIGKVLAGGKYSGTTEALHNAILWAANEGADIISMSLGMDFRRKVRELKKTYPDDVADSLAMRGFADNVVLFHRLSELLISLGRYRRRSAPLLFAAAGNESKRDQDINYKMGANLPATADGFLPITAVQRTNLPLAPLAIANFANTGARFAGPGVDIRSANRTGGLISLNGTSMASPHVVGVAALWTEHLFGDSRPDGWSHQLLSNMTVSAVLTPGLLREDVGMGVVQAPNPISNIKTNGVM